MKEELSSTLQSLKTLLKGTIYPLKEKYDKLEQFNEYFDVLDFILWLANKHPEVAEEYDLVSAYDEIGSFMLLYATLFGLEEIITRDFSMGTGESLDEMIDKFYEHIILIDNKAERNTPEENQIMSKIDEKFEKAYEKLDQLMKENKPVPKLFNTRKEYLDAMAKQTVNKKSR